MNCTIKKLLPTDFSLAKQLLALWQGEDGFSSPTPPGEVYLKELLSKNTFHVFVALEDANVIGGLTAYELPMFYEEAHEMFLYDISVGKEYRQQGVAAKLVEALKSYCNTSSIKIIFVGTDAGNKGAIQLYNSTGAVREDIPWFTYHLGEE